MHLIQIHVSRPKEALRVNAQTMRDDEHVVCQLGDELPGVVERDDCGTSNPSRGCERVPRAVNGIYSPKPRMVGKTGDLADACGAVTNDGCSASIISGIKPLCAHKVGGATREAHTLCGHEILIAHFVSPFVDPKVCRAAHVARVILAVQQEKVSRG
jgi:hypothetical protein